MRVLHLAASHRWTGAAEPAAALAATQLALGHEVSFACTPGSSFWRALARLDLPRVEGFRFQGGFRLGAVAADVRLLRRLCARHRYDVVHCHLTHDHWLGAIALGSARARNAAHRPLLVRTMHRDVPPQNDPLHRWLFGRATDLLIAVSRSGHRETIDRFGPNGSEGRVAWIRGAVDTERFHPGLDPALNRKLWRIPEDAPVAGMVARMQRHRGHLDFIETIGEVLERVPKAVYLVAGQGEIKRTIRLRMIDHPHASHLVEAGYRKNDLAETYAAMDVAVLLARGSDGTCRAMLEAMACGRPVIGIDEGAIADSIEPGKTGWLLKAPVQGRELASALVQALGDLEQTRAMGRRARARIEQDFTQRHRAEATQDAYEQALSRRAAAARA